jgi:carbamoylphosphate synthase large subunit
MRAQVHEGTYLGMVSIRDVVGCLLRSLCPMTLHHADSLHVAQRRDIADSLWACMRQVSVMVAEHREEVRGLHEYIQGSY